MKRHLLIGAAISMLFAGGLEAQELGQRVGSPRTL